MTRKEFIKNVSFSIATIPLLSCEDDSPILTNKSIIIVGAGMAGLTIASLLQKRGVKTTIIEAENRIGGRIFTDRSLGIPIDMGASWIHGPSNKNPITDLAKQAGARTFKTDEEKLTVFDVNGKSIETSKINEYYNQYTSLIKKLANAADENKSISDIIKSNQPDALRDLLMVWQLTSFAEFDIGGSIEDASSKYWDDDENFNGDDVLFPDGYDALTKHLSNNLDIKLGESVNQIDFKDSQVKITTSKSNYTADFVVVTVPLGILKSNKINFTPTLPKSKLDAISRIKLGSVTKIALQFPSSFWDNSKQYFGFTDTEKGRYPYFMNCNTFVPNSNILMGFCFGNYALKADSMNDSTIQSEIMSNLKKMYGNSIPNPTKMIVSRWSKEVNFLGAYSFLGVSSKPDDYDEIGKQLENKLFFAGEHTNKTYRGTVHGAYLSGQRIVDELVKLL